MEISLIPLLGWAGAAFGGALLFFLGWILRNKFVQVDKNTQDIIRLEENAVNAEQVRIIMYEGNEPLRQSLSSLETQLAAIVQVNNSMLQELAAKRGYDQAMRDEREKQYGK